jgi:signal transduction histidine kinase
VVSHELRTPINAVVGYAALLHERLLGDLSEGQERAVRRIEAAAQQLLAAVNHALLLAHIDVGDFEAGDFARRRGSGRSPRKQGAGDTA